MTAREFAFVGVRILALYCGVLAVQQFVLVAEAFVYQQRSAEIVGQYVYAMWVIPFSLWAALGLYFWFAAGPLSKNIAGSNATSDASPVTPQFLVSVAVVVIGVIFLVDGVASLGESIYSYHAYQSYQLDMPVPPEVKMRIAKNAFLMMVGTGLIVGAGRMSKIINRLRYGAR